MCLHEVQQDDDIPCGVENSCPNDEADGSKIVGGEEACPHQFPWLVSMWCREPYLGSCTATLLFEDWVLTAAHCTDGCTEVEVYVGAHSNYDVDSDEHAVAVTSEEIFQHPDYLLLGVVIAHNDIALIRLPEPMNISSNKYY